MGFWDKKLGGQAGGPPPAQVGRPVAPPRQGWPPAPQPAPQPAPKGALGSYGQPEGGPPEGLHQDFEDEITPETHPWAFQMGADGRPQRSVWTWRGNRQGGAAMTGTCPNCRSGNYIPPAAQDDGWHGGQGATSAGVTNVKTGQRVTAPSRCLDCGYPKLQQGSGAALSGGIAGHAPSAGVGGFRPIGAVGKFDSSVGRYVKIGD